MYKRQALSRDLEDYLTSRVGITQNKVLQIYNGVDTQRFQPAGMRQPILGCPFSDASYWLVGTVGRTQTVKDQTTLARAFIRALEIAPELKDRLRLVMIGDGPLKAQSQSLLEQAGCTELAWLPGERNDVPEILPVSYTHLDVYKRQQSVKATCGLLIVLNARVIPIAQVSTRFVTIITACLMRRVLPTRCALACLKFR